MTQGMYTAVSGIRANQTKMNVISNNIANVNTLGFKSSSANFATVFSSTISGGSAPNGTLGGTNPKQLGNGALVSEIATNFAQGGTQYTGRSTDAMINGGGYFAVERINVNNGNSSTDFSLTRAGNFSLDSAGNLVTTSGNRLRGTSQTSGSGATTLGRVQLPQEFIVTKQLNAQGKVTNVLYSPKGTSEAQIQADFDTKFGAIDTVDPTDPTYGSTRTITSVEMTSFSIGSSGAITATYSNGDRISARINADSQAAAVTAGDPTLVRTEIYSDVSEGGTFAASNVTSTDSGSVGQVTGREVFTGGVTNPPAGFNAMEGMQLQIQTASVTNSNGLLYDGNNNFLPGANSGVTSFGISGSGSRGDITSGSLESSNVDLAGQFTDMIIAQRGLEAASKMVRAQSETLQTIIQMV